MEIQEIGTIHFLDHELGDQSVAIIRVIGDKIALCLSHESNGDNEVLLDSVDCRKIVEALQNALKRVGKNSN